MSGDRSLVLGATRNFPSDLFFAMVWLFIVITSFDLFILCRRSSNVA
jgi:hypothetical protein